MSNTSLLCLVLCLLLFFCIVISLGTIDECGTCHHKICEHNYHFEISDGYQNYEMTCLLCGRGNDESSIAPVDPRKMTAGMG